MDETELQAMEALKAAYAEVILNTMKEAAARVMESEQKALRFEQDLQSTKDESLRLLLRLKSMVDAKATEAEISSINQQRRIDELEAQLNEAEGLVVELRAELNMVQDELDEEKKKNNNNNVEDNPVLTSMIMKNEEAEMYRNGFTQRICAVEMKTADEKLHPADDDDPCVAANSKPIRECTETKASVLVEAPLKTKKMENHVHQIGLLKDSVKKDRTTKFRGKLKRRKSCHGKAKTSLHRCLRNEYSQSKQPLQTIPHSRNHTNTDKNINSCGVTNTLDNSSVLGEKVQQSNTQSVLVRRSVRKRKIKYWDDAASVWRSHDHHSNPWKKACQPCHMSKPVKNNVQSSKDQLESQSVAEIEKSEFTQDIIELDQLVDVPVTLKEDSEDGKTSQRSYTTLDQADREGQVVYTFSRKRKKDSFINPENSSGDDLENGKRNIRLRQQDSGMVDDSSRKNKQLAQVAHQLISLSGNWS